ncbi:MAG: hypothetical protein V1787_05055 [Candidatus Micrarchaeota archaeon]
MGRNRIETFDGVEAVISHEVFKHPERIRVFAVHLTNPLITIGGEAHHYDQVSKHLGHGAPREYREVIRGYIEPEGPWSIRITADTDALNAQPRQALRLLTGLKGFLERIGKADIRVRAYEPYVSPPFSEKEYGSLTEAIAHFKRLAERDSVPVK